MACSNALVVFGVKFIWTFVEAEAQILTHLINRIGCIQNVSARRTFGHANIIICEGFRRAGIQTCVIVFINKGVIGTIFVALSLGESFPFSRVVLGRITICLCHDIVFVGARKWAQVRLLIIVPSFARIDALDLVLIRRIQLRVDVVSVKRTIQLATTLIVQHIAEFTHVCTRSVWLYVYCLARAI